MSVERTNDKVGAVIVTFNSPETLKLVIEDLKLQIRPPDEVYVIDNSDNMLSGQMIAANYPGLIYVKMKENAGSAGGYSEGLKMAAEKNSFVWTLDDDVRLASNALSSLLSFYKLVEEKSNAGAVRCDASRGDDVNYSKAKLFPWRGTLIRSSVIKDIGLPIKEFFLYEEDLEYSTRIYEKGYDIYFINKEILSSPRVNMVNDRLFNEEVCYIQDKFRLYYTFRNEINRFIRGALDSKRDGSKRFDSVKDIIYMLIYSVKVVFCNMFSKNNGLSKAYAILEGINDGILFKLGKNIKYLPGK